jgi:AraC-like DNA-binding protein
MALTPRVPDTIDFPPVPADPLGEALHSLHMSGVFYARCEFSAPWGLSLPPFPDCLMFHVVTSGACWLEVEGADAQPLQPGGLALVPHGEGHRIVSQPAAPAADLFDLPRALLSERYELIRHGGGGERTSLICGVVRFDHPAARHLVSLLPGLINVDNWSLSELEWMHGTLRFMAGEARELRAGGETIITRLADILVIQAIRTWIAQDPAARTGWLGALRDQRVGRALALIHGEPERGWTVASLAEEAAMSRSAFAARFTALVGEPPMHYLTRWRMQVAVTRLSEDDTPLAVLANDLGYQSEAAFNRAFKRFAGMTPGAARRRA